MRQFTYTRKYIFSICVGQISTYNIAILVTAGLGNGGVLKDGEVISVVIITTTWELNKDTCNWTSKETEYTYCLLYVIPRISNTFIRIVFVERIIDTVSKTLTQLNNNYKDHQNTASSVSKIINAINGIYMY